MSNFDLNIQNYTQSELQEIFDLKTGYKMNQLLDNEAKLIDSIKKDKDVNEKTRNDTMKFIEQARNRLVTQVSPTISSFDLSAAPSVVPPSYTDPTHPSRYFPPLENPVAKQNRTMILNVDSRFRENYYTSQSSNFHVTLPMKIDSVVSMKLAAIEFPPTAFFSVNKTLQNNYFWVRAGSTSAGDLEETRIVLPDGNFTPTGATEIINDFLQSLNTTTYLQYIYFSINQSASGTNGSGQLIVAVNESYPFGTPFNFEIDLQASFDGQPDYSTPLPLKLGWRLGFRNGSYIENSSYMSEGVVNLSGASYLFLAVDDYNNYSNTFFGAFNESLLNKNILARIAVQSSRNSAITFSNVGRITTPRQYYGPVDIEKLQVQMLDEYGRILNLNNMDFSFVLEFATGTQTAKWPTEASPAP